MSRFPPRRLAPALFLLLAPAAAEADRELSVYVNGGVSLPSDPPEFVDFWDAGPSVGVAIGTRVSPYWEVLGTIHYQRFPADERAQIADLLLSGPGGTLTVTGIDGRDATALTVTAEARFHFQREGRVLPYLAFGWGLFEVFTSDAVVTPAANRAGIGAQTVLGDTDGAFGVTTGAGAQFPISPRWRILVDSIYAVGFTEGITTQFLPFRVGLGLSL